MTDDIPEQPMVVPENFPDGRLIEAAGERVVSRALVTETCDRRRRPMTRRESHSVSEWEFEALEILRRATPETREAILKAAGEIMVNALCEQIKEHVPEHVEGCRRELLDKMNERIARCCAGSANDGDQV